MKLTNLEWEDVIQFEEVDGYGKEVWKHNNQYYIINIESGMMDERVVYELPDELFSLLESRKKTLREVSYRVKNDCWPPTELKEIMPIAEKIWIESEGKLPDDYVSPLK